MLASEYNLMVVGSSSVAWGYTGSPSEIHVIQVRRSKHTVRQAVADISLTELARRRKPDIPESTFENLV